MSVNVSLNAMPASEPERPAADWPEGPRPRRVLMTADTVGGVWTYAMELCRGLGPHGVEVTLAAMGDPVSDAQQAEVAHLGHVHLESLVGKLEWMDEPQADVERAAEWLLALAHRDQPDLVHLNSYAHAALPWGVPVIVVAHSCVFTWWKAVLGGEPPSGFNGYARSLRAGVRAADRLVAPSRAFLEAFCEAHGFHPRAEVIYNGRDASAFRPAEKQPCFLSVGRLWDEAKNAAALARVAPDLPWPVRVAGSALSPDGQAPDLRNVELLGRCPPERVAQLMAEAAVYVLPARYEPFGLSILEAALSGCALVLGDIPTLREVWGDAAVYVSPGDIDALRERLTWLAHDATARVALGVRARERAGCFGVDAMTRRYLEIYRDVLAPSASGVAPDAVFAT